MSVTTSCSDLRDRIMVESESQTTGTLGNNKLEFLFRRIYDTFVSEV